MSTTDHNCLVNRELADEQLMVAFQGGDREAFATIYYRHQSDLEGYFVNRLHSTLRGDAEDLLQRAFARLARFCKKHPVVQSSNYISTLLYKIAASLVKDHLRHRLAAKRDCRREETPVHAKLIDVEGENRNAACRKIDDLLECLPPLEAKAVRLKALARYTGKAAAEAMGIKLSTFDWYYRKAQERLKEIAAWE